MKIVTKRHLVQTIDGESKPYVPQEPKKGGRRRAEGRITQRWVAMTLDPKVLQTDPKSVSVKVSVAAIVGIGSKRRAAIKDCQRKLAAIR